jgi:hypothetical protein
MLLAFVTALGIDFLVFLSGSAEFAAAIMVVSFIAICWPRGQTWGLSCRRGGAFASARGAGTIAGLARRYARTREPHPRRDIWCERAAPSSSRRIP